jgi:hypothetical protein
LKKKFTKSNLIEVMTIQCADLDEHFVDVVDLLSHVAAVADILAHGVHVVECDEEDVFRAQAQRHLILEGHRHQVVQLKDTQNWPLYFSLENVQYRITALMQLITEAGIWPVVRAAGWHAGVPGLILCRVGLYAFWI